MAERKSLLVPELLTMSQKRALCERGPIPARGGRRRKNFLTFYSARFPSFLRGFFPSFDGDWNGFDTPAEVDLWSEKGTFDEIAEYSTPHLFRLLGGA